MLQKPKHEVQRQTERYTDRTPGYQPHPASRTIQELVEVDLNVNGRILHRRVIDMEIVPEHVMISLGCYGDTGGWRSKFVEVY